jgi:hypothetical protein
VEGGSGPVPGALGVTWSISTVLTDKDYATTLIDYYGGSNGAEALLGPQNEIFGTASQWEGWEGDEISSTFDFSLSGDLLLGVIDGFDFDIIVNGVQIFSGDSVLDTVINLGFLGPNIDLTVEGQGVFFLGAAVPESSTWAMMLIGFAGLGFAGYRSTQRRAVAGLRA